MLPAVAVRVQGVPVSCARDTGAPAPSAMRQSGMLCLSRHAHTRVRHVSRTTRTCARAGYHAPSATLLCVADQ